MRLPTIPDWPRSEADVVVGRHLLTDDQEQQIKTQLRFENPEFFKALNSGQSTEGLSRWLRAYEQHPRTYRLPRHAPFQRFGIRTPQTIQPTVETLPWLFTSTLRPPQNPAFKALQHQLIHRKDGILVLSCGKGKTVLAIAGFGWLQQPALAVITQLPIGKQWKQELLRHTDIPEDRVGLIGDGYAEWDKDFVIATIQTLAKKDFPWQFYRRFGVVFFDEAHRLGAQLFGRVASMFTGVRIGLTATPDRSDAMERMFQLHVGRVFYEDKTQDLIPRVYFLRTPTEKNIDGFRLRYKDDDGRWRSGQRLNMSKIVTHLSKLDYRHEFLLGHIEDAFERKRKTLVLGERRSELEHLHQQVQLRSIPCGLCLGQMKYEDQQAALNQPVTLATAHLVKEALDKKEIDTLIIMYPQSSPSFSEQAAGRILRLDDQKRPPVVVVLVDYGCYTKDGFRPFVVKARKMEATFRKLGYQIVRGVEDEDAA